MKTKNPLRAEQSPWLVCTGVSNQAVMWGTEVCGFQAGCEQNPARACGGGGDSAGEARAALSPPVLPPLIHVEHCRRDLFHFGGSHVNFNYVKNCKAKHIKVTVLCRHNHNDF